jgi:signal transduction histidine kinase
MPPGSDRRRPRRAREANSTPADPAVVHPVAPSGLLDARFFRHVVRSVRNGVIVIHRDKTLALANDEAYRIFLLTRRPDDVGRPFTEVFRERPDAVRALSAAFELTTLPNRAELRLKDIDRVIGYTLSLVKDESDATIGAVMFFKDLTQLEQMEEQERLRDRLASLGEMAAGIAHELKNPLAGIEVMAGLLRRHVPESAAAQSLLADIISEAKLANAIVVQMLEFVRPIRLQVERADLRDVLHQAITLAESKAPKGGAVVRLQVAPELPSIHCDPFQLCQVFTNLLTNAFEALNGRGHIDVTAGLDPAEANGTLADAADAPGTVVVDVADEGPGVPLEVADRVFDPFFTTKPQGSGLGLPIVRKIVDAHEGRIDLVSRPGEGTRFRVTLPVSSNLGWFK